ncbi:aminotransferase class I/II-fold pyridoxal phosphate-dependent enzyme [Stratiformator vulcanicus]|uniref:8-amino-7-oxononanoate synthase 2 n=1 Tax=Stratiformator vulcanicus TaxID=2527980 RepID=A0A517R287_9PLAN|nr:8-amino-7-oxononanoate synthase [Stratiformator vulcanicus]QDT38000.1 8-amino-7-oxononanoate synthase 2 [Stratiformator vulcanicus]
MHVAEATPLGRTPTERLESLAAANLRRERRTVRPIDVCSIEIDGRTLLNFGSNDYLGLSKHPDVLEATIEAVRTHGVGSTASALICGRTEWHERLERRLAEFEGAQSAVLFPTGYAANLGTIAVLAGAADTVFCERTNHACIIDGCRLSGARLRVFRRDRLDRLATELDRSKSGRLIAVDGIFSMEGDVAPLRELHELAVRYDATLLIDEAHATGILGETGRGSWESCGIDDDSVIRIGTMSKALGACGGFVVGQTDLTDLIWNTARTQMFSTALPPAVCAAVVTAIDVIAAEPNRRLHVRTLSRRLRSCLADVGIETLGDPEIPIVPVVVGDPKRVVEASSQLADRGFFVPAIRQPTVPRSSDRLRMSLTADHSFEEVERLAAAVADVVSNGGAT